MKRFMVVFLLLTAPLLLAKRRNNRLGFRRSHGSAISSWMLLSPKSAASRHNRKRSP